MRLKREKLIILLLCCISLICLQQQAAPIIKILNADGKNLTPERVPLNAPLRMKWSVSPGKGIKKQTILASKNKNFFGKKIEISGDDINSENDVTFSALLMLPSIDKWYIKLKVQIKTRSYYSKIYSVKVMESLIKQIESMKGMYSHYGNSEPPAARWLLIDYNGRIAKEDMKASLKEKKFPVFSFYSILAAPNIPTYKEWVITQAEAIGSCKNICVIVLEPDRFATNSKNDPLLDWAIETIKSKAPNAALFLDIGHSNWISCKDIVKRVKNYKSYKMIDGFASNVSNFRPDKDEAAFALKLFKATGKPVIIDTSRNGLSTRTGKCPSTVHNPPRNQWEPGKPFAFHPKEKHIIFNYHNKPHHEKD